MLLTDILGPLGWRITDGGEHGWNCYGEGCRSIELGDDHRDGLYIYLVFDPKTLRVFEVTGHGPIYELTENNPWRWIDAEYQSSFRNECTRRRIKWQQAWDDVMYSEVDDEDLIRLIRIGAGHLDTILAEKMETDIKSFHRISNARWALENSTNEWARTYWSQVLSYLERKRNVALATLSESS